MRRKGLIVKAGVVATAPYIITPAGTDLLNSMEAYTPAIYWQATWGIGKFNTFKHIGFKNLNESLFPWEQPNYAAQYHGRSNC
jgi:hypothetical protein